MSDKALDYAIDIAKNMNMKIIIVRVIDEMISASTMVQLRDVEREKITESMVRQLADQREQEYNNLKKQLSIANSKGVEASALVLEGDVINRIMSTIEKENPYIVVVGSRKLQSRGISKLNILGSVARKLSEGSKCPILIIR
jgi:nucleotide-binding universal stress UspA family protein